MKDVCSTTSLILYIGLASILFLPICCGLIFKFCKKKEETPAQNTPASQVEFNRIVPNP